MLDVEQGTEEWMAARRGIPTASNFDKIVTSKGELSKQSEKYCYQLAGEAVSGYKDDSYKTSAMERGIEFEAEARDAYSLIKDKEIAQVGLCFPNDKKEVACSPDGLIGHDGLIEIKCPLIHTHVSYLLDDRLPTAYVQQIQGQLFVTDRQWCDFMSYYPGLRPLIVRVHRDEVFISRLETALAEFNSNLKKVIKKIK